MTHGKTSSTSHKSKHDASPGASEPADLVMSLVKIGIGTLFMTRLLVPTESTDEGSTLWIAQLWLGLAVVWTAGRIRQARYELRWNWIDTCVWTIVLGQVVSAFDVLAGEGNQRAAVNLLWEWVSLGTAFFIMRQELLPLERRQVAAAVICAGGALAGLGIWQHHVSMRATADEFVQQLEEVDALIERVSSGNAGVQEHRRLAQLTYYFGVNGVPIHGPGRARALDRIQGSREPIGMFALANTLAGFLLVAWCLAADWARTGKGREIVVRSLVCALIGYCLILTKSRTAWVGLAVGLGWWWLRIRARSRQTRDADQAPARSAKKASDAETTTVSNGRRWIAVAVVVLCIVVGIAGATGGLDPEVLTEAPKSLEYRLQYWTGTWLALQESPVMGLGIGNFREHYVAHKLAESSEEISDPHNLFLDAWSNGGVISLAGLVGLLAVLVILARKQWLTDEDLADTSPTTNNDEARGNYVLFGVVLGPLLVVSLDFAMGAVMDLRQLFIASSVLIGLMWVWPRFRPASGVAISAAGIGLVLHLCGAGGFGMPAITMLAALLLCLGHGNGTPKRSLHPLAFPILIGVFVALSATCFSTATQPHLQLTALEMHAMADLSAGSFQQGTLRLKAAAEADPLSPRPLFRLAETLFMNSPTSRAYAEATSGAIAPLDDSEFDKAVKMARLALERDPLSSAIPRRIGQWFLIRANTLQPDKAHAANPTAGAVSPKSAKTSDDTKAAVQIELAEERLAARRVALGHAVRFLAQAAVRYPNHSGIRSDYAEALALAGSSNSAAKQAARALELDAINRNAGHSDRYLPQANVDRMREIAEGQARQ